MDFDWLDILLVVGLVLSALATVSTARLLRAVIGLALTSVILTVVMFRLASPLAAVFELSVCAGLIPAIFISTIGLTGRVGAAELAARRREKLRQYWLLPIILIAAAVAMSMISLPHLAMPAASGSQDVRTVLWNERHADLIGQVVVLLAGALGVVILVKERKNES